MITRAQGLDAVRWLEQRGLDAHLIGSLRRRGSSRHDIDVLILQDRHKVEGIVRAAFPNCKVVVKTDWGGLQFLNTEFGGTVDVFFLNRIMRIAAGSIGSKGRSVHRPMWAPRRRHPRSPARPRMHYRRRSVHSGRRRRR